MNKKVIIGIVVIVLLAGGIILGRNIINQKNNDVIITEKEENENNETNVIPEKENGENDQTNIVPEKRRKNFSNNDAKEILQKYLDLSGALAGSPRNLLIELGLLDKNDYNGESVDVEGTPYITTNIKFSEFKDTMLRYVSEKCYEEEFARWFKSFDWVYYRDGGATGRSFEVVSVNKISDTEYTAKVNEIMIDDSKELKEYRVNIVNYNGKYVMDSCVEK